MLAVRQCSRMHVYWEVQFYCHKLSERFNWLHKKNFFVAFSLETSNFRTHIHTITVNYGKRMASSNWIYQLSMGRQKFTQLDLHQRCGILLSNLVPSWENFLCSISCFSCVKLFTAEFSIANYVSMMLINGRKSFSRIKASKKVQRGIEISKNCSQILRYKIVTLPPKNYIVKRTACHACIIH